MSGLLVIGSTGLLGQAFMAEARRRGLEATGAARRGADITVDIGDADSVRQAIALAVPDIVVNTAAIIDIGICETDPEEAERINARAAGDIARLAAEAGAVAIQISTDHYYTGDGNRPHGEDEPVELLNGYASSKRRGEELVLAVPRSLVVRTNILGFRGWEKPTFIEWAVDTIVNDREATLFEDSWVSALDVGSVARLTLDLAEAGAHGLVNVGCREVYSKKDLIEKLAAAMGRKLTRAKAGSVRSLAVRRADSLGLDVSRAEGILGRELPDLGDVIDAIVKAGTERNAL